MEIGIFKKRLLHSAPEFRFWHTERQRMYIVDSFTRDGQLIWWPGIDATLDQWDEACSDQLELTDGVLMQFTGLLDCADAKVWEGDIVYSTFEQKDVEGGLLHSYCHVVFARGGFGLVAGLGGVDIEPFNENCGLDDNPVEAPISNRVVGNIYQHLHLLSRDYYSPDDGLSTGIPPDMPGFDPESIYTFYSRLLIGTIGESGDIPPSDKYLVPSYEAAPLLPQQPVKSPLL